MLMKICRIGYFIAPIMHLKMIISIVHMLVS